MWLQSPPLLGAQRSPSHNRGLTRSLSLATTVLAPLQAGYMSLQRVSVCVCVCVWGGGGVRWGHLSLPSPIHDITDLSPCTHTHTDQLTAVSIILPDQSVSGSIPAGISLLYSSAVTTQYSTNTSSGLRYSWDFDDGFISDKATVEHVYSHAGTYTVMLEVQNDIGSVHNRTTLHVYQGTHPSSHTYNLHTL